MNTNDYFWIIGGGILQIPLIEEVKKLGMKTIVSDANKNCICKDKADIFVQIDIFDIESHVEFADSISKDGKEIRGVLAAGIDAPETMAVLSKHLKLPGVSPEIARIVNNKDIFRKKMTEIGIDVPKFEVVDNENIKNLEIIIKKIGFPLIVKNTSSSGSRGTKIFYENNFLDIYEKVSEAIEVSRSSRALIESLWVGTEHTVETIFDIDGVFHECFITDRIFDLSEGYALETGLVHPSQLDDEKQKKVYALAKEVSDALGIKVGASKFDIIYTDDGPKIIEMTVRLSGGFDCQYLVPAATGKNILKTAILTAIGENFDKGLLKDNKGKSCISESLWPKPGVIKEITGIEDAKISKGFEFIHFRSNIGDEVSEYNDCTKRVCFILVSGKDLKNAKENMKLIKNKITITTNH